MSKFNIDALSDDLEEIAIAPELIAEENPSEVEDKEIEDNYFRPDEDPFADLAGFGSECADLYFDIKRKAFKTIYTKKYLNGSDSDKLRTDYIDFKRRKEEDLFSVTSSENDFWNNYESFIRKLDTLSSPKKIQQFTVAFDAVIDEFLKVKAKTPMAQLQRLIVFDLGFTFMDLGIDYAEDASKKIWDFIQSRFKKDTSPKAKPDKKKRAEKDIEDIEHEEVTDEKNAEKDNELATTEGGSTAEYTETATTEAEDTTESGQAEDDPVE